MYYARVLLVDDEILFVATMTKRLLRRELKVTSAFSGTEALSKLETDQRIDVVILDVKFPKWMEFQLPSRLR